MSETFAYEDVDRLSESLPVKKRYYKEVECRACDGLGKRLVPSVNQYGTPLVERICECCNGRGTQTVLEREEI